MGNDGGQLPHKPIKAHTLPISWFRISGGYADTYIHPKTKKVFKYCQKYFMEEGDKPSQRISIIHYSTVCDLVFSKVLMELHGFPKVNGFEIGDTQIKIEMDYLGKTLHDAAQTYTKQTRWALAPKLLDYLTRTNFNLWYNGIQHTDIKPGNILIDSHDDFHLIDFNCMSLKVCTKWTPAIGTWHYVAPEILMSGTPYDNSMIWSIGMVIAHWICGEYPISQERMKRYIQRPATSQTEWRTLMTAIRKKYPDVFQLEQLYVRELGGWWNKLKPLLRWSGYKRWGLERVFQSIHPSLHGNPPLLHVRNIGFPTNPLRIPEYVRESVLQKGLQFLRAICMEWTLVNTMSLFDRSYPLPVVEDTGVSKPSYSANLWFVCCWAIQGYLTNDFLFDNDCIVFAIHSHYHLTCDTVMNHIYTVLNTCQSLAWQKEWTMYLPPNDSHPHLQKIQWEKVVSILLGFKEPYTPERVAIAYQEAATPT